MPPALLSEAVSSFGAESPKGSKGLSQILNAEILEAFEQRKDCARNQGEEAATRLLFPMVMMLAVVMILILIPAGMSMQM